MISVVIPCHNAAEHLAQTLGSVLDQTRPPGEIIVVDDGSADESPAIARRFESATDGLIRVYAERSGNAARTRTIGADLARGGRIMFLDADDVLDPRVVEGLAAALDREPAGVAIVPWRRLEFERGRWLARPASCRPWSDRHDDLANWLMGWYHPTSTVMWSRHAYDRTGGWDPLCRVNDDGDLMMRTLINGTPLLRAEIGTCYYRRLPETSLSAQRATARGLAARLHVVDKLAFHLDQQGRLERYRHALAEALLNIRADADSADAEFIRRVDEVYRAVSPGLPPSAARGGRELSAMGRTLARNARDSLRRASSTPPEPITHGLARAAQILDAAPEAPDLPPPAAQRPTVTVIIPTYNRAATLPRAIDSVLRQTHADLELLVVDDGSTDDTPAVMESLNDPRIRFLRQPENRGVAAARNRGLRAARGDFIAFLDSDDEWLPDKLERQLARFAALPEEVGLLYTGVETIAADGHRSIQAPEARGDVYPQLLLRNKVHGGGSNAMIRRCVIATVGFFDETLPAIEDYDYWLRVARFFRVDFVPEPLLRYHTPPAQQRKSLDHADNVTAREMFYRRYRREMRRAGVAHLFLLDSAGRHLATPRPSGDLARRLALRAARRRPLSRAPLYLLLYTLLPSGILARLRQFRHRRQTG